MYMQRLYDLEINTQSQKLYLFLFISFVFTTLLHMAKSKNIVKPHEKQRFTMFLEFVVCESVVKTNEMNKKRQSFGERVLISKSQWLCIYILNGFHKKNIVRKFNFPFLCQLRKNYVRVSGPPGVLLELFLRYWDIDIYKPISTPSHQN